jgi:hypothetical protein
LSTSADSSGLKNCVVGCCDSTMNTDIK